MWEPEPKLIDDVPFFKHVLSGISVLYLEVFQFITLCGLAYPKDGEFKMHQISAIIVAEWITHMRNGGAIILCARSRGYYIFRHGMDYSNGSWVVWLPCYHDYSDPRVQVSYPGAGGAFLGAMAYAWRQLYGPMEIVDAVKAAIVADRDFKFVTLGEIRPGRNVKFLTVPYDLRELCVKWGIHLHEETNIYQCNAHVDVSNRPGMDEYLVQYYHRESLSPSIESFKETLLIRSPVFQLSQTPQHVKQLIAVIRPVIPQSKLIWEPAAELINDRDIPLFKQVCNEISVLYIEAFHLMALSGESPSTDITEECITDLVSQLWLSHIQDSVAIIVRSRSKGYWICLKNGDQDSAFNWLPLTMMARKKMTTILGLEARFSARWPASFVVSRSLSQCFDRDRF
ncbi:hypothetical protein B0T22DRAFT_480262 [Podospora appendiculata]|uniref:Uncharacterized protein n=1 Tax=Podospora appendiculata TaxID=314037 RepID=A0AAE0XAE1_9PEZI|nr:hypothetical protein B0T22DRAFT_480262 [Podospora appendiculata]